MAALTRSESLAEMLMTTLCLSFNRIPTRKKKKTPDYRVDIAGLEVLVEVKQLDETAHDLEVLKRLEKDKSVAFWSTTMGRLRYHLWYADQQLESEGEKSVPGIVAVYSQSATGSLDQEDIRAAMFGDEIVKFRFEDSADGSKESVDSEGGLNNQGLCDLSKSTAISAVALVWENHDGPKCSIFHNPYAAQPLAAPCLWEGRLPHYVLAMNLDAAYPTWHRG